MDRTLVRTENVTWADTVSGVCWGSVAAGAVVAASVSLALFALGAGLGLSSISPWAGSGVSASTFKIVTGLYLVVVAVMSSAIGGYLAARLRNKWIGLDDNEAFFRDTAHGLIAWALATVLSATALGAATTHIVSGAASGALPTVGQAANTNPSQVIVDRMFRAETSAPATPGTPAPATPGADAARAEVLRLWTYSFPTNNDLGAPDRVYVARLVAAQTGLSQPEAEKRVNDVIVEAKAAADRARKESAKFAFWMTAALLFGAFAASLAAVEGGQLRDGTWNGRRLTPRAW